MATVDSDHVTRNGAALCPPPLTDQAFTAVSTPSPMLHNLTLNGCYRGIDRVRPERLAYNDTVRTLALGCRNQFCNCLGDVVRIGSVGRSEDAHEGLQHLAGDRSNLAVGCARLSITRLLSRRKQVGRVCARLYEHDIEAELGKLITVAIG